MKYVEIAPGLPPSSILGFGCGSMMGRVAKAQSLRAVAAALDRGITHFDVARSYGYGEAEAVLGEALLGRRDRVVIASKFGRPVPAGAAMLSSLKPLARLVIDRVPLLRPLVRGAAGVGSAPRRLSPAAARSSLEASLAALRTDYLDILLLHDCAADDVSEEIVAFCREQVANGKIRAFGVATDAGTIAATQRRWGNQLLYQFRNSVGERNAGRLVDASAPFVTHGPFAGAARLAALLERQPQRFRRFGPMSRGTKELFHMMLAAALAEPKVRVVLASMLQGDHLSANLEVVERPMFSAAEIAEFCAIVAAEIVNAALA